MALQTETLQIHKNKAEVHLATRDFYLHNWIFGQITANNTEIICLS